MFVCFYNCKKNILCIIDKRRKPYLLTKLVPKLIKFYFDSILDFYFLFKVSLKCIFKNANLSIENLYSQSKELELHCVSNFQAIKIKIFLLVTF